MPKSIADVLKNIPLDILSVSPDGRLRVGEQDLLSKLREEGIEVPPGTAVPLGNWVQCNVSSCKPV
jgi:hypothetical protein